MIRINLLPVREKQRIRTALIQLVLSAIIIVICVGAGFGWNYYYQEDISIQEKKIAEAEATINQLQKTIGEVNQLKKTREKLSERKEVIDKLQRGKTGPVRVLDALANHIPKRIWLDSVSEKNGELSLEGKGLENSDVSEFMRSLSKSKYFKEIDLKATTRRETDGVSFFEFQIRSKVDFSG